MRLTHLPARVPNSRLSEIPDGNGGVKQTLLLMRQLTRQGKRDIRLRTLAASIVQHLPQKNWIGEIKAIQEYVKNNIRYLRDIREVETVQTPDKTLELGYGDCDDKSTLAASLLESIGHPTRFVACGFSPDSLSHVYVETKLGGKWISVETTEPVDIGWQPKNVQCKMVIHN